MSALPELPPIPGEYELELRPGAACARRRDWLELLAAANYSADAEPATRPSVLSGRRPLQELHTPRGTLLLRRFTHGGLLRSVTGARFRDPTRPFHELALAHELARRGLGTPEVIGARARAVAGGGWHLDLLSLRVEGARDLESLLVDRRRGSASPGDWRELLRAAGAFVRRLHEVGLLHADLTPKNLLVSGADTRALLFHVLDLDRSRLEPALGDAERERNLRRLLRFVARRESAGPRALRASDYLRFLSGYEPDSRLRHALARALWARHRRSLGWHRLGWGLEGLFPR